MKALRLIAVLSGLALATGPGIGPAAASTVVPFELWFNKVNPPTEVVAKAGEIQLSLDPYAGGSGTIVTLRNHIGISSSIVQFGFGSIVAGQPYTLSPPIYPDTVPPGKAVLFAPHSGNDPVDLPGQPFAGSATLYLSSQEYEGNSQRVMGLDRNDEELVVTFTQLRLNDFLAALAGPVNVIAVGLQRIGEEGAYSATYVNATLPIPEPGTLALMAAGIAFMAAVASRRVAR